MAKHTSRRKFRRYLKGQIDSLNINLASLAANTGVRTAVGDTVTDRTWLSSVKCTYALDGFTFDNLTEGPIEVYVAHSDYTLAEVEEYLEQTSSWEVGNKVGQEIAKRKVRYIGTFDNVASPFERFVLNDGRPITTKCNWMLEEGQTVAFVGYNSGTGALGATDPNVIVRGHANLWPTG